MRMKDRKGQRILIIAAVIVISFALFGFCYRHDNKYTRSRPYSDRGVTWLEEAWYRENPLFYLADGWAFYRDKLLSPDQIASCRPDAFFYIGRYGGFDLGDAEAQPYGKGTYRTVILTQGGEQEYALELTPIYSRWKLWINGKLMQSVGMGEKGPRPPVDIVTFTAGERIEIVVEVEDYGHFYSGMVYPPAFGVPEQVSRTSALRLLIHGAACMAALVTGTLCFGLGAGSRFSRPYGSLALLCICFCGSTAWPLFQVAAGEGYWYLLGERLCYYGMFLSMIWIQGRICSLPKKAYIPACAAGLLVCLSVLIQPWIPVPRAGALYGYSYMLGAYKWLTALWLLAAAGWALYKKKPYSFPLLAGNYVFMCALAADKLMPLHEPVLTGWFVELAGAVIIVIAGGIALYDMDLTYRESLRLKMRQRLSEIQLEARSRYGALQQEYIRSTRRQLHETRNQLTLIKHYLETGEQEKLKTYLEGLLASGGALKSGEYTGHTLIDSILTMELETAGARGIYVEAEGDSLPPELSVKDSELTSLFMNLLENAIEACGRLPCGEERWIFLEVTCSESDLTISCTNSCAPCEDSVKTSKEDYRAHGYGLDIMRQIVRDNGGTFAVKQFSDSFSVRLSLPDVVKDEGYKL